MEDSRVMLRQRRLALHWMSSRGWFASRGYDVWYSSDEGASWLKKGSLKAGLRSWVSRSSFLAQAGRLGIQNLARLSSGTLISVADGVVFRSADAGKSFSPIFSDFQGRRPLRMGICEDDVGRVYLGEYWRNPERRAVHLWRSDDDALTWRPIHTWPSGAIGHIHFVQFDPYDRTLWVGTGDEDHECHITYSHDGGQTFEAIGGGTQQWRAASILFTQEAIVWGTDIGIDHDDQPNHILMWERATRTVHPLRRIDGPVYYSTQLADGTLVVGTAVERVRNEMDRYLRLLWTKNHRDWESLRLWPKISAPRILGPSTITFPQSDVPLGRLLFNVNFVMSKYNGSLFELII